MSVCIFVVPFSSHLLQLLGELLHEGQPISVGLSPESGQGGQWLAYVTHLVKESSVTDVTVVPVGISYDCVPKTNKQVAEDTLINSSNTSGSNNSGATSELT